MKRLLKLCCIHYEISDIKVLENVNASIQQGERIGIIGKNGAGKSTLLKLINNDLIPTDGHIQWLQQDLKVVVLEQETQVFESEDITSLEVELLEKWQVPSQGFEQLSGGEKLKARLAKVFAARADLLLLDEPTNHLDEQSIKYLTKLIQEYKGTILFVSHDRSFLDAVATKIWSLEGQRLIEHKGNYSSYMEMRRQRRLTQQREYEKQQKMVEQIEGQVKELTNWSKKAHAQSTKKEGFKEYYRVKAKHMDAQVKSKRKRLEKELEKAKAEPVDPEYTVKFAMKANKKVGKRFLEVKNVTKYFAGTLLFSNVNFSILHGEKVALIGPNGSGKTTLLKILLGQETAEGDVWISPSASIGYLTQEVFDLPLEQTPAQLFSQETFEARGKVQSLMNHLGFTASQWTEPIRDMSMGERVKCKLMKYILEDKDVLILDEPTNHLDLPSREQLEETLAQYAGTLIVVSHDHYFLRKITGSKLIISNHSIERKWNESPKKREDVEEVRLKLETERQAVLGKLSLMTPKDNAYAELDLKFKELTKQIKELQ